MPNGDEVKESVSAPVEGGFKVPEDQIIVSAGEVFKVPKDQIIDSPPSQAESDEFNSLLNEQLLSASEAFAAPETTIPRIDLLTPEAIEQREEALGEDNQKQIDFFNKFNERVEVEPPPEVIRIDESLQKSVDDLLFDEGIKDSRTFAIEHIKTFDSDRFEALQERIKEGRLREQDEIDLVNEGIKLKAQALRLIFDQRENQIRGEADELVSSEEFQQISRVVGEQAETLDEQITQREEVKNLGLSLSGDVQAITEELSKLEKQSDTFVQKKYPETATKILESQVRQSFTDVRYIADPRFRAEANTTNLMIRSITGVLKGLANIPGVDAVLTPVVDKFSEDNREEFSEIVSNWVDVFNDIVAPIPTRIKQGRALFEDQAEVTVDGQKLDIIFEQDHIIDVRIKEGTSVTEELAQKAVDEFNANPVEIKSLIDEELLLPKMVTSLSEIALLIGGARVVSRGLSALGTGEKFAKTAGLFTTNFVMMNDGFYREARNNGLGDISSSVFATASAVAATTVMMLNPGKFVFGREAVMKFTKQYADKIATGITTREALKETFKAGTKEALNFNLFVGSLAAADNIVKYVSNKFLGSEFEFEQITRNQVKEDLIINSLTGFLIGTAQGLPSNQISRLQKDALFSAAVEKDTFLPRIRDKIRDGEIDKETGERLIAKIEEIAVNIGKIPQNLTMRDKSELMTLLSERLDLKKKTKDENLGEAFKKEGEERLEQIDNEMADIIARKPVAPEKPTKKVKPEVKLTKFTETTEERFGEVIEIDAEGKQIRREDLTREQFEAEQIKAAEVKVKEAEEKVKITEEKKAKEVKGIDAKIEAERAKIEKQQKLDEPDAEIITASETKITELEAQKVEARPVKEVRPEDITREDEVIDTKIEVKPDRDIAKERDIERKKEIKEEFKEDMPKTPEEKEAEAIKDSKTLDEISQIRREIKEQKIISPQDLKDKIDKTIDSIREAKAIGAKDLPFLRDIPDKILSDIKNETGKAKNFNELETQFSRIEKEIEDVASEQVQSKLLGAIKKEVTLTKSQKKGLSPFVNEELGRFRDRVSFKDPESFAVQRALKAAEWNKQNPNTLLPERILAEIEDLNKQNLRHLSNAELGEILDDIRLLKSQGKTFNRLKMARAQRERDEIIKEFNDDILAGKELKPRGEILPEVKKTLTKLTVDAIEKVLGLSLIALNIPFGALGVPIFLKTKLAQKAFDISALKQMLNNNNRFDILEENAKGTIYRGRILEFFRGIVNQAREVAYNDTAEKTIALQAKMAELNLQNLGRMADVQGRKLERRILMRIFMATKDPSQLKSLLNKKVGNGLSKDLLEAIENELTTEEKQMVEWLLESFQKIHPEVDAVYRQSNFMPLPKNPGFSPILKEVELLDQVKDFDILGFHLSGKGRQELNPSFIQERSGSESALNLDIGAIELYTEYVKRTSQYKALELPLKEINAVIKGIKDAVVQEQGIDHFKLLTQWSENLVSDGRYTTSKLERFAKNLRIGLTKGILSANVVVALKQTISGTAFLTELTEAQMFAAGKEYWNPKNNFENARRWNEFMNTNARKAIGERGKEFDRDIKDALESRGNLDKIWNPFGLSKLGLRPIGFMDGFTVRLGFVAAYKADGGKLGEPVNKKALSFALGLIERTQPRGDIKDLAAFQTGSEMNKLLTMFQNQRNQYYNVIYANLRAYSKGRIGRGQLARALVYAWIVPTLLFETISAGFTPDDEDLWSAVLTAPLGNIFILGGIVDAARTGYDHSISPVDGLVDDVAKELGNLKRGEIMRGLLGLAFLTGQAKGLPLNQLRRTVTGAANLYSGKTKDWRRLIWSKGMLKDPNNAGGMQIEEWKPDETYEDFMKKLGIITIGE